MGTENQDILWYKMQELYRIAAQNPILSDTKRQILFELLGDVQQQHMKTIQEFKIKRKATSHVADTRLKSTFDISRRNLIRRPIFTPLTVLRRIVVTILLIIFVGTSIFYFRRSTSEFTVTASFSTISGMKNVVTVDTFTQPIINLTAVAVIGATTPGQRMPTETIDQFYQMEYSNKKLRKTGTFDNAESVLVYAGGGISFISLFIALVFAGVSTCLCIRLCFVIRSFCCLTFTPAVTNDLSFKNRTEKIILLDPSTQHLRLHTLFEDNLVVYTSASDCFSALSLNRLDGYILFLSLNTFETHSFELSRLSNVSLGIFYDDNIQVQPQISKTKYNIRFMFPESLLQDYLRHVVTLYYIRQAFIYRREGLEREADESSLAAIEQCRKFIIELEQQAGIIRGTQPEESHSNMTTTMEDLLV